VPQDELTVEHDVAVQLRHRGDDLGKHRVRCRCWRDCSATRPASWKATHLNPSNFGSHAQPPGRSGGRTSTASTRTGRIGNSIPANCGGLDTTGP
jgi:hypothetical protein